MFARRGLKLFLISLKQVNDLLLYKEPTETLPEELKDFADVFSPKEVEKLPLYRPFDHDIKLVEGKTPPFGPLYPMS